MHDHATAGFSVCRKADAGSICSTCSQIVLWLYLHMSACITVRCLPQGVLAEDQGRAGRCGKRGAECLPLVEFPLLCLLTTCNPVESCCREGSPKTKTEQDAAAKAALEAFHLCPNLEILVPALLEGGPGDLQRRCSLTPGGTQHAGICDGIWQSHQPRWHSLRRVASAQIYYSHTEAFSQRNWKSN